MSIDIALKKKTILNKKHHCSNCGVVDPKLEPFGDGEHDGLTECCNEDVCHSSDRFRFYNEEVSVEGCCWAYAECEFIIQDVDVVRQYGMQRKILDNI